MIAIRAAATVLTLILLTSNSMAYVVGKRGSKERKDDCYMQADICYRGCEGTVEELKCFGECQKLEEDCNAAPNPKAPEVPGRTKVQPKVQPGGVETPGIESPNVQPGGGIIQQ